MLFLRDGLKESDVVSKQFTVEDAGKVNLSSDPYSSSDLETSDFFESDGYDLTTDSTLKSGSGTSTSKSSKSSKSSKDKSKIKVSLFTKKNVSIFKDKGLTKSLTNSLFKR